MKKIFLALLLLSSQQLFANTCPGNIAGYNFLGERDGHKYFVSEANFNHENANAAAAALGGYMASITSVTENNFLKDRINKISHIGFNDLNTEGTFTWPSGEPVSFNNLEVPNSQQNDYANMNFWNGGWGLDGFYTARPFILEIPCDNSGNVCPVPAISSTETTPTNPPGIFVRWNVVTEANSYSVEYTNTASNVTNTATTSSSNIQVINGIELGQNYSIRVRSNCGSQQSAFSNSVSHTTAEGVADVSLGSFRNGRVVPPGAPTLITADMTILNRGSIAATFELRTYLSTDNNLSSDDIRLNVSNAPAGFAQMITLNCCFTNSEVGGVYTIPGGLTSGDYFFIAVIDEDNLVEGVGGTLSRRLTIDPAPASLPNLFTGLRQFDQPVVSPSSVQLDYEVVNSSNTDAVGPFNVETYISPNDVDPANDILLATRTISGGIPLGDRKSDSATLNIPGNLATGEYRFIIIADSENQISELDDNNSTLRIFDLIEDDNGGGGDECPGNIQGYTDMGELDGSKYYLSDDRENWNQASALTRNHDGYLASINNAAENTFLKERIDEIVLVGLTDKDNEGTFVWDSGEGLTYNNITGNNNSDRNDFSNMNFWNGGWDFDNEQVSRRYIMEVECNDDSGGNGGGDGKPDLNVSNLSSIPSGAPGQVLNYTFDLNNFQPVIASESYRIGMYVSTDSILSSDDILAGIVPTGNTPEGTISSVPGAITVPAGLAPGPYFLIVKADIDDNVDETNETNNITVRNFSVTSAPNLVVDMELSMTVDKPVHESFSNFTFTITASNKGSSKATGIRIDWIRSDTSNMAFVDVEASKGESLGWTGSWDEFSLDPGESATLEVIYFFKDQNTTSSLFAAVTATNENDIDSTPSPGLPVDLVVREDDEAIARVVGGVASCNDPNQLFAFVGQSNMAGEGDASLAVNPIPTEAFEYHIQTDSLIPLAAPTGEFWGLPSNNNHLLSAATTGSLLPAFANAFNGQTGNKITAIHTARGGAGWFYEFNNFGTWQPGGQTMTAALHKIDAGINRSGLPLSGVVFLGGETDIVTNFGNNFVEADFKEGMRRVMRTFRQKYNAPLYFILPGFTTREPDQFKDPKTLEAVRFMQEVYEEPEFASYTLVVHDFNTTSGMRARLSSDGIHYTQAGYNAIGTAAANYMVENRTCP